ncbi:hypothetical protein [Methanosarcina acetivorans]|uniref:hypothetical protein n=1 Tax=Methanosarcina acetivorans TaxID=2214 RepID=UPI00247AEC84|nr:hypothetical protein [Methanosarcina acetivorans]
MRIPASGNKKGVLVIHGGYDSCMEDFHSVYRYLIKRGYEIIAFEGPGKGASIHKYHLKLTHEWEKPTIHERYYLRSTSLGA